jgi:ComF family protein
MLRELLRGLTDIIYPKTCVVCRNNPKNASLIDDVVCGQCWGKIKRNLPPFCHSCGRQLDNKNFTKHICPACVRKKLHFDRAFSPCVYDGTVKDLIHEFKYKGKDYLGRTLSRLMVDFIREYNVPIGYLDFVIPVPLHKTKLREREFNQAEILSDHIAEEFAKDVLKDALLRHRPTQTQTELEPDKRLLNVRDSFSVRRQSYIQGKNILLVDDVLTTAATSSEAAGVLKQAGANIVFVLTLAN